MNVKSRIIAAIIVVGVLVAIAGVTLTRGQSLATQADRARQALTSETARHQYQRTKERENLATADTTAAALATQELAELAQIKAWQGMHAAEDKKAGTRSGF